MQLQRGKSQGISGILPEMIEDAGELVKQSLLWLFNCVLAGRFPEHLSVGLSTAVYKSGDESDMSSYRGTTVGSVIANLFAMILEQNTALGCCQPLGAGRLQERLPHDCEHSRGEITY